MHKVAPLMDSQPLFLMMLMDPVTRFLMAWEGGLDYSREEGSPVNLSSEA